MISCKIPYHIITNNIEPYTRTTQSNILLSDIRDYMFSLRKLHSLYLNVFIQFRDEDLIYGNYIDSINSLCRIMYFDIIEFLKLTLDCKRTHENRINYNYEIDDFFCLLLNRTWAKMTPNTRTKFISLVEKKAETRRSHRYR